MICIPKRLKYEDTHKQLDNVIHKLCLDCDQWFRCDKEYFYENKKNKIDGLMAYCKECWKHRTKQYQEDNYERYLRQKKEWYRRDIEANRKQRREHKRNNKERYNKYHRNFVKNNPDKIRQYGRRQEMKKHTITDSEWNKCKAYFDNSCAYCGMSDTDHKRKYKQRLHREHVIAAGRNDIKNCVPACKQCNSQKHEYTLNQWYNSNNPRYTRERYLRIYYWLRYDCKIKYNRI